MLQHLSRTILISEMPLRALSVTLRNEAGYGRQKSVYPVTTSTSLSSIIEMVILLSYLIGENISQQNEQKLSLVSLKEVEDNLKSKIVDSPEKLKNYKDKMKGTVQKLRSARVSRFTSWHSLNYLVSVQISLLNFYAPL
jgi:hypothetical protein